MADDFGRQRLPWSASFNTTTVGDGLYDIRALAVDSLSNQGTDVATNVRVDNTLPTIVTSAPLDGTAPATASSIAFDTSEVVTLTGVTLDGNPAVAPTITGTHADFATGALAPGPHTLAGTLNDAVGKTTPFRIHFTVYPTPTATAPYTEKNTTLASATTLNAADGSSSVTMPANDWSGGIPSDWLVVRVDPTAPTAAPAATMQLTAVVDVSAYWALAGAQVHAFNQPLDVVMNNAVAGAQAATYENGAWRIIQAVPNPGQLPAGWNDGYYQSGGSVHILTRHLSFFAITADTRPPSTPTNVTASVDGGNLTLHWTEPSDGGPVANFVVYVDGKPAATLGSDQTQYTVGPFDPNDAHSYSIVAVDGNGKSSPPTSGLRLVPNLVGLTLEAARAALIAAGFSVGDITVGNSTSASGTVIGPTGVRFAAVGSPVGFQLSGGSTDVTKYGFYAVDAKGVPLAQRKWVGLYFFGMTRPTNVTVQLIGKHHKVLRTWHTVTRGKVAIRKLLLPKSARRVGATYTLRSTAVSGTTVIHRTNVVRVYRSLRTMKVSQRHLVDIVVAGTQLPKKLPTVTRQARRIVSGSDSSSFTMSASLKRNVQVVVVDVDEYGVRLVHNLHLVFPGMKLIAVSSNPARLARARRFGATITLPKTAGTKKLAKAVSQLSVPYRLPASHP